MATEAEKIILGSGKLYTLEFSGQIPENEVIEKEENRLGSIQGGATVEYKPKFVDVKDDLGLVQKTVLTDEEVTLKSGILTWNGKKLKLMCCTARVNEANGKRTVKIGGLQNQDGKQYIIRFVHEDKADGDVRVTIVGNNQAGFSIKFVKDKETVIDAEFKAAPLDNEGTKIIYEEDIPTAAGTLNVTSAAGTLTGATKLTVSPSLTAGNSYMYKVGTGLQLPKYGDICDAGAGYGTWNGSNEITATTGSTIVIVEVDSSYKAVKAGTVAAVIKSA